MEKKQYQKPVIEKVNLRITESVLTACKTNIRSTQPGKNNAVCNQPAGQCSTDQGS
jgi:hypothetical protein